MLPRCCCGLCSVPAYCSLERPWPELMRGGAGLEVAGGKVLSASLTSSSTLMPDDMMADMSTACPSADSFRPAKIMHPAIPL